MAKGTIIFVIIILLIGIVIGSYISKPTKIISSSETDGNYSSISNSIISQQKITSTKSITYDRYFDSSGENLITDGNWDTGVSSIQGSTASIYITYSKPSGASKDSLWEVKDSSGTANLTIPSICWNYYSDKILLRAISSPPGYGLDVVRWECYDGDWNRQILRTNTDGIRKIYEERMWWSVKGVYRTATDKLEVSNIVKQYPSPLMSLPDRCSTSKSMGVNIDAICGALCQSSSLGYDSYDCENDRIVCNCIK